jgi:hypothetical protein
MKRLPILLTLLLPLVNFSFTMMPDADSALAQSGCCKRRASLRDPWSRTGDSFDGCKRLNDQIDKDNVLDERGLIWWDSNCS